MKSGLIVGIDASRNRSGGAKSHIKGILAEGCPLEHGIQKVHIWAFQSLLDEIPDQPWLIKHNPKELEQSLFRQLWWQAIRLKKESTSAGCNILFTTDASTLCRFKPMVVMSQDMLSYEPGVMRYFGFSKQTFRLLAILILQNQAMRFADGVIFLTKYAANVIQQSSGLLPSIAYIPHGVGHEFKSIRTDRVWSDAKNSPIRCLYVSNTAIYKNQWVVVRAIAILRKRGYNIILTLAGGGSDRAQQLLDNEIAVSDPEGSIVSLKDLVPHKELPSLLASNDLFVFASSCENLPVTLLEAMAVGLPIACSNRGPMPEVLEDGGVYFDPENAVSIANAVEQIIVDSALRTRIATKAKSLSEQYSWSRCAEETWEFITETYRSIRK